MKKIMFDDKYGLTKAVLEGRKTMTRRVVNPDILPQITEMRVLPNGLCQYKDPYIGKWYDSGTRSQPKYKVGEVVAVAQRYKDIRDIIGDIQDGKSIKSMAGWSNKMFVRTELMPHQIRITSVLVERLQDINDEDCRKEGIDYVGGYSESYYFGHGVGNIRLGNSPRESFAALINKVSGKGTFESNPWVFVYEFEIIK